jgi:ubiquinone/menaquinone biosynthesis C-methylase UbiE
VFNLLVALGDLRGRRVLDVGTGTGALAAALAERAACRVWAVEPSAEMLEVARRRVPRGVGLKHARAEELPFRDGWFDRAVARLVAHLVDRPRAFGELHRVLVTGGRLVVATFDESHFGTFWLNRFFPSLAEIDSVRFPRREDLRRELEAAGFDGLRFERLSLRADIDRGTALKRIRGRYLSTFDLLPPDEVAAGTARAETELPERVGIKLEWLIAVAERPAG